MNNDKNFIKFINEICKINTLDYDYIYRLDDNCAGCLLLIKGNNYHYVKLGSVNPIISESKGVLEIE